MGRGLLPIDPPLSPDRICLCHLLAQNILKLSAIAKAEIREKSPRHGKD
jgi:hypothetical protein